MKKNRELRAGRTHTAKSRDRTIKAWVLWKSMGQKETVMRKWEKGRLRCKIFTPYTRIKIFYGDKSHAKPPHPAASSHLARARSSISTRLYFLLLYLYSRARVYRVISRAHTTIRAKDETPTDWNQRAVERNTKIIYTLDSFFIRASSGQVFNTLWLGTHVKNLDPRCRVRKINGGNNVIKSQRIEKTCKNLKRVCLENTVTTYTTIGFSILMWNKSRVAGNSRTRSLDKGERRRGHGLLQDATVLKMRLNKPFNPDMDSSREDRRKC